MSLTRIFGFAMALAILIAASPASALVTGVTSNPDTRNITFNGGSSTLTVVWVIDRTTAGGPVDLRSPPGRLIAGNLLVNTPVRRKLVPGNPATITFVDTVTVPAAIMRSALRNSGGQFQYFRDFSDDPPANTIQTGQIDVFVTGSMGGPLSLSQVTLQFDNGATYNTVHRNDPLRAKALIHSGGSGQLAGVWEVSEGENESFFRPIRTVNITLTGQRIITEISPPLPTQSDGRRKVRFRVTNPPGSDIRPAITYYVTGAGDGKDHPYKISVQAPASDALVSAGTGFKWTPVNGAAAYRLQLLDLADNPAAAMLVRGNETALSAFVLAQLQGPATYRWRITALNSEGGIIGTSVTRAIKVKGR